MTTMLLYKEIKALNRDEHKVLKIKPAADCAFAANTHLVPLAGLEFFQAARHYPIVFIGQDEQLMPIALLGLTEGHNSYLDESSQWQARSEERRVGKEWRSPSSSAPETTETAGDRPGRRT